MVEVHATRKQRVSPRHQEPRNVVGKDLCHVLGPDVGDALEGEAHVHGIAGGEVVLDALVDEVDQVAVLADQNGDEQVALQ